MKAVLRLLVLVMCWGTTYSQQKCFQILNKDTKTPVPFATITCIKCSYGSYSDENGRTCFDITKADTIVITSVGFAKLQIPLSVFKQDSVFYITPQPILLNEVSVKRRGISKQDVGPASYHKFSLASHSYCPNSAAQLGVYISNPTKEDCTISKLIYKLDPKKSPFIKSYKCKASVFVNDDQKPGRNLLCTEKPVDVRPEDHKIVIDITECNIAFPETGAWICIETVGYVDIDNAYHAIQQNSVGLTLNQNKSGKKKSKFNFVSPYYNLVPLKEGDIAKEKFWTLPWKEISSIIYSSRTLEFGAEVIY